MDAVGQRLVVQRLGYYDDSRRARLEDHAEVNIDKVYRKPVSHLDTPSLEKTQHILFYIFYLPLERRNLTLCVFLRFQ